MSNAGERITQLLDEFRHSRDVMVGELSKVIVGQREVIDQILAAIFTRGHILLVGVPGLAKTLLVSSVAPILDEEKKILSSTTRGETVELNKVLSGKAIVNLQKLVASVPVSDYTVEYVARLVRATRPGDKESPAFIKELVDYGAGPRAGQN